MVDKDKSSEQGEEEHPVHWLKPSESIQQDRVDNVGVSPEEEVRLVTAYASIRNPILRQAVLNFIRELAKTSDSSA